MNEGRMKGKKKEMQNKKERKKWMTGSKEE